MSSANSSTIIFIKTEIFSSKVSQEIPGTLFALSYPFKSFRYIENKRGDRFSPWRTPVWQGKKASVLSAVLTLDFILLYILVIKHFPFILVFNVLCHNPVLQTVSNAYLKSMNVQKSFDLFDLAISIKLWSTNKLSIVENPFRNPA